MVGEVLRHMVGVAESFAQQRPDVGVVASIEGAWPLAAAGSGARALARIDVEI
jgi:hypothetical protein